MPIDLPDDAFNTDGDETLAPASVLSEAEYVGFDGDAAKATLVLVADLGTFGDVKPEHIALEDNFEGGKVESVSKEGEDNDTLKVEVSFPKGEEPEDDYLYAGTLRFAEVRLKQMQDDIYRCYVMFDKAAEMLAERKDNPMEAPAAGASNEEAVKYNAELSTLMLQQQALRTNDELITKYRDRLYEGDIWEDLKFAGLEVGDPNQTEEYKHMFGNAGIAFVQDVGHRDYHWGDSGDWNEEIYSWVRGIRPDKQITSENAMQYEVDHLWHVFNTDNVKNIKIYAHFIWFDRR